MKVGEISVGNVESSKGYKRRRVAAGRGSDSCAMDENFENNSHELMSSKEKSEGKNNVETSFAISPGRNLHKQA